MARPLRIEYAGAVYHITSRGNARQRVFVDDADRTAFFEILAKAMDRFNWLCHAYCLMGNHYHLLIETVDPTLARGMRLLNGTFTQAFNRRHGRAGHVLQGRFKGILVEKEGHLLELARYVVLNPVRAGVVKHPRDYRWSSYCATAGEEAPAPFLTVKWILSQFDAPRRRACSAYRRFVMEGLGVDVWDEVNGGILLGTGEFVAQMGSMLREGASDFDIRRKERFADRPSLAEIFSRAGSDRRTRNLGVYEAAYTYGYRLTAISEHLGLHPSTLSRIVKRVGEDLDTQGKV